MKCAVCGTEFNDIERCPNCGVLPDEELLRPQQFNLDWLGGILGRLGYRVEVSPGEEEGLYASHEERANLLINVDRNIGVIMIRTPWKMHGTEDGMEKEMLEALNRANGLTRITTFYLDEDMKSLMVYTHITLGELISEEVICDFLEQYDREMVFAMGESDLLKYG